MGLILFPFPVSAADPSTVGTSTSASATLHNQRKTIYDGTNYWTFWWNGTHYVYSHSTDLSSWSSPPAVLWSYTPFGYCGGLDVKIDGATVYVAQLYYDGANYIVYFRTGTASGTTITWQAAKQVYASGGYIVGVGIEKSTSSRLVIVFHSWADGVCAYYSMDGGTTWNAQVIVTGWTPSTTEGGMAIVKMASGKLMTFLKTATDVLCYSIFSGSAWDGPTMLGITLRSGWGGFSAVSDGNVVHLVYEDSSGNIGYMKYSGTQWLSAQTVQASVTATSYPVLSIDTSTNNLYCFWAGSPTAGHIYYKKCTGGTWDSSPTDCINEATDGLTGNDKLTAFMQSYGGCIGLAYMTKSTSPYNVRLAYLQLQVSITITSSPATGSGYCTVDGNPITTPATYSWNPGDSHTIAANSPVTVVPGQSQYVYSSWSDSGAQSHSITVPPSTTTYTANFQLQYYLSVSGGDGSGAGWYNSGASAQSTASYVLNQVNGQSRNNLYQKTVDGTPTSLTRAYSGTSTQSFTMSAYHSITWSYYTQYYLTVTGGNSINYGTASPTSDNWYDSGQSTTVSSDWVWNTVSGQSRTAINNWQLDGAYQNPTRQNMGTLTTSSVSMSTYHTVSFVSVTQYYNTLGTAVSGSTVTQSGSQTGDSWYDIGTSTTITATSPFADGTTNRFLFSKYVWSQGGIPQTDITNNPTTINMSNYISVTANWVYDKIVLYDKYIPWTRVNVGSVQTISLKYRWQSDNSPVASDWNVQVNGTQRTITSSWTNFTAMINTVGYRCWQLTWANGGNNYLNSITPSLIWEGLKVDSYSIDMANAKVHAHMKYAYDGSAVSGGTVSLAERSATTNSTGWAVFDMSIGADFSWGQTAYGVQDGTYGITYKAQNQTVPIAKKTRFIQSDAQINSLAWDGVKLTVGFSGSTGSYTLKVSGARPTYVIGTTFDISTDYTSYLSLSHDGSRQIVVSYSTWGDFYMWSLNQGWMTNIYWTEQKLTVLLNGTSGTTGTLAIYCGSRGAPTTVSGFSSTPEYSAATKILTGQYQFSGQVTLTLELEWTVGGPTGGGESTATYVTFVVATVKMGSVPQGQTVNAALNMSWMGVNQVTITRITFTGDGADWLTLAEVLPKTLTKEIGSMTGSGIVTIRLNAPADAKPGDYTVPVRVESEAVGNRLETSSQLTFRIVEPTIAGGGVSEIMTYLFAALIIVAIAAAYLKRG
jgi:hypothetical protein